MLFSGHPSIRRVGYCRERDVAPIQYSRAGVRSCLCGKRAAGTCGDWLPFPA